MLAVIKELTDRFIEFILSLSKGETLEAQLTSALKSCIFVMTAVIAVVINLVITNIHQRIELKDMEEGIAKVSILFDDTSSGSINGFLRVNRILSEENISLKKDNIALLSQTVKLGAEYRSQNFLLLQLITENKTLIENNSALLLTCPKPK